jgi:chemotaxis protein MotB
MASKTDAPILIKKIKKSHGAAHHASAWKIAYADLRRR